MTQTTIPGSLEPSRDLGLADRLTAIERQLVNVKALTETAEPIIVRLVEKAANADLSGEAFNAQILVENAIGRCKDALELLDWPDRYGLDRSEQPAGGSEATVADFSSPILRPPRCGRRF